MILRGCEFYLAIETTKNEIKKLYDNAAGKMVGGFTLQDVFKMDKAELDKNGIQYDKLFSKEAEEFYASTAWHGINYEQEKVDYIVI